MDYSKYGTKLYVHAWPALGWILDRKLRQVLSSLTWWTTMIKMGSKKVWSHGESNPDSSYAKGILPDHEPSHDNPWHKAP